LSEFNLQTVQNFQPLAPLLPVADQPFVLGVVERGEAVGCTGLDKDPEFHSKSSARNEVFNNVRIPESG
jgi:hypothetical protein